MLIAVLVYLIVETINIIYTSKFGFSHAMDQPMPYRDTRKVLVTVRFILVILIFFLSVDSNLGVGIVFLIAPALIDKIIFQFCKNRERKRLIKLFMSKEDNPNPMSKKDAEESANDLLNFYSENNEYAF